MSAVPCLFVGDRPDPTRCEPISMAQPRPLGKPQGGLWTCREVPGQRSAWVEWCERTENSRFLRDQPTWRLVADQPRIFTIDTHLGLTVARDRYPHQPWPEWPSHVLGDEVDYVALAEDYDAVELTARGLDALRFHDFMLYGWDVPTILWLRWPTLTASELLLYGCVAEVWWLHARAGWVARQPRPAYSQEPGHAENTEGCEDPPGDEAPLREDPWYPDLPCKQERGHHPGC